MRMYRVQTALPLAATMLGLSVISSPVQTITSTNSEQPLSATQLLIRTPKALHVRQHWHSANETPTMISGKATFACEGNRVELGPGGFNYMPARMVHEAWTTPGSVVFITVDGPWDVNWVEGPPTSADVIQ